MYSENGNEITEETITIEYFKRYPFSTKDGEKIISFASGSLAKLTENLKWRLKEKLPKVRFHSGYHRRIINVDYAFGSIIYKVNNSFFFRRKKKPLVAIYYKDSRNGADGKISIFRTDLSKIIDQELKILLEDSTIKSRVECNTKNRAPY